MRRHRRFGVPLVSTTPDRLRRKTQATRRGRRRLLESIAHRVAKGRKANSNARDKPLGDAVGFYLRQHHGLVHRHVETFTLQPELIAEWQLTIEFELPANPKACLRGSGKKSSFLFPLAFLSEPDLPSGLKVEENGNEVPRATPAECNRISVVAVANAIGHLAASVEPRVDLRDDELQEILKPIVSSRALDASMALQALFSAVRQDGDSNEPATTSLGIAWDAAGLTSVLKMLVEHSILWVPIDGEPGERRVMTISRRIPLKRRTLLRWSIGELGPARLDPLRKALRKRSTGPNAESSIRIGNKVFGRRSRRFSFGTLRERLIQPLGLMPIEFECPTIYAKRALSYEFQVYMPDDLSTRALRLLRYDPLAARDSETSPMVETTVDLDDTASTVVVSPRIASYHRYGGQSVDDLVLRIIAGVSAGAVPIFWWLASATAASLLWAFVAAGPEGVSNPAQPTIIVGVFSFITALVVKGSPDHQGFIGARLLLLSSGLSLLVAALVVGGARPFALNLPWLLGACATAATAAAVLLAASWALSTDAVWGILRNVEKGRVQTFAPLGAILAAALPIAAIHFLDVDELTRGIVGIYLLPLASWMLVLANSGRGSGHVKAPRYTSVSLFIAAVASLTLACIELQGVLSDTSVPADSAELYVLLILLLAPVFGLQLQRVAWLYRRKVNELIVSPHEGREMIAGRRVSLLTELLGPTRRDGA
jgi:hypothetical protein